MSTTNKNGRWEFDENGNVRYIPPEGENAQTPVDGNYRFSGDPNGRPVKENPYWQEVTRKNQRSSKSDESWHWILIVLGFVAFWPVGLILLLLQVGGRWPGSQKLDTEVRRMMDNAKKAFTQSNVKSGQTSSAQPGNYGQTTAQVQQRLEREREQRAQQQQAAQTARQEQARKKAESKKKKRKSDDEGLPHGLGHVRLFRWIGGIIAGLFGFTFVMTLIDEITYFYNMRYLLGETLPRLALALIGVTFLAVAGTRKRKLKKFQKYLSMIGKRDVVPIETLAKAMGVSEKRAEKDLEEMLERDFWEQGYVDAARRALVLGSPVEDAPAPEVDQEVPETDDTATQTLRHIRDVNDAIADSDMSDKICRIEELTAKIFKLLEERPEKSGELRSFMNYYLPQTLKILENYAKLEAQGIEGENITEAKEKIEGMMDKLVDGYETQLDKLFADDVLDISADLKVMEQMLEKDGLAMENEMEF